MPNSMLLNRLRYYRYETIALIIVFACLTVFAVWKTYHTVAIESDYIADVIADLTPADTEMNFLNDTPINANLAETIDDLLGSDLVALDRIQRTAGLTCGVEENCHQGFAIHDPLSYIRLIEGDFPQETDNDTRVQALISQIIAERKDYEVGTTFLFGADQSNPITVEIVGIFEPIDAVSPVWTRNAIFNTGVDTPVGTNFRFDFGFMVTNQEFTSIIDPASQAFQGSVYNWIIHIAPVPPTLTEIRQRYDTLQALQQTFLQEHLQGDVITRAFSVLERIEGALQQIDLQLWVLFFLAVLMLSGYGVYIHHVSTLHQIEWQRLSEMGFRPGVILRLRVQVVSLLASVGYLIGLVIATLLWGLPAISVVLLALIVVGLAMLMIVGAGQATSTDEQTNHPPFMFDAQLDMLLILTATILFVRLFIMSSDNIGESIQQLLASPAQIFSQIEPQLAQMPVNFLIPFLLSLGVILLVMRILWRVLGANTQLNASAMMLIALAITVTLTTLLLDNRLDRQLQTVATQQTGGTARVLLNNDLVFTLPESIKDYAELAFIEDRTNSVNIVTLIGLDAARFVEVFPEYTPQLEALLNAPELQLSGLPLPDEAVAISLEVYSPADDSAEADISVEVEMRLLDNQGRTSRVKLSPVDDPEPDQFVTYQASLTVIDDLPLRLSGIVLDVARSDTENFAHTLYFDTVTLYDADGNAEIIEDFEANRLSEDWIILSGANADIVSQMRFSEPAQGSGSLRTTIRMSDTQRQVVMPIAVPSRVNFPALASPAFITWVENLSSNTSNIIGINQQTQLNLPLGTVDLPYQIVDTIDSFPVVGQGRYLIMPLQALLFFLNDGKDITQSYGVSELWLSIPDDELDVSLRAQLPASTLYAQDIYQQSKSSVYPRTMIDLFGLLSVLSIALSVLVMIRLNSLRVLFVTVLTGVMLGVFGALMLANLFPMFSIL